MAKAFAWSYSKLKNYETCAFRHLKVDLEKAFSDTSEQLDYGNKVHDALANALRGTPLPVDLEYLQKWVDRVKEGPGKLLVEQKWAITKEFKPCPWFGNVAWYRGIGDVVRLAEPVALILDWKTGKPKDDSVQLALTAQCVFAHYPEIQRVRTEFVWLQEDDAVSREVYSRDDMADLWAGLLGRVDAMRQASLTMTYPQKPGKLCKRYCPVNVCPFWHK